MVLDIQAIYTLVFLKIFLKPTNSVTMLTSVGSIAITSV